jgi:hypothetical protein
LVVVQQKRANKHIRQRWQQQFRRTQDPKEGVFSASRTAGETWFIVDGCLMLAFPINGLRINATIYVKYWFFMTPSIATKFQYVNLLLLSFSLTTCFGPYGPSSGEIYI